MPHTATTTEITDPESSTFNYYSTVDKSEV